MNYRSLEEYTQAVKKFIFELSYAGETEFADRVDRLVFESGNPDIGDSLAALAMLLCEIRTQVSPTIREKAARLESFARNFRRAFAVAKPQDGKVAK